MVLVPDVSQLSELGEDELAWQEQPEPVTEQEIPLWLPEEPDELLFFESEHAAMLTRIATPSRNVMGFFTATTLRTRRKLRHGHSSRRVATRGPRSVTCRGLPSLRGDKLTARSRRGGGARSRGSSRSCGRALASPSSDRRRSG